MGAFSGAMPLYQAWLLMAFGYAFIGLWLLLLNLHARLNDIWPRSLTKWGLITGMFMAVALMTASEVFFPSLYSPPLVPQSGVSGLPEFF